MICAFVVPFLEVQLFEWVAWVVWVLATMVYTHVSRVTCLPEGFELVARRLRVRARSEREHAV